MADKVNNESDDASLKPRIESQVKKGVSTTNTQMSNGPSTRAKKGYIARSPVRYSPISSSQPCTRSRSRSERERMKARRSLGGSSVNDNQSRNPFEVLDDQASDDSSTSTSDRPCEKCGGTINEDVKALQCEFCAKWVCLVCSEVPEKMYDIFIDDDIPSFLWSCASCIHAIPTIKNLGKALQGVRDDQSETKAESGKLNAKVDKLESSIDVKVQEAIEEYRERENRKCNLILHNIPESKEIDAGVRRDDDIQVITDVFKEGLGVDQFEIQSSVRLGRKSDEGKNRLMKVTVDSVKTKREILSNAKKLKNYEKWSRVFITPDLSPKQRERSRALREELKRRQGEGEEGLMIRKGEIVKALQGYSGSPPASQGAAGGIPLFR